MKYKKEFMILDTKKKSNPDSYGTGRVIFF